MRAFMRGMENAVRKRPAMRPTSDEDAALFREAIGTVRPLADDARSTERAPPPPPRPVQHLADEARVLDELRHLPLDALVVESGAALSYLRDGHDPRLLKRLKSGAIAVQDEIDLHSLRLDAAQRILRAFLAEAAVHGLTCLRVIHGKGLRSEQGPVLKAMVDRSLRLNNDILAFCSARAGDGGTGATLVLLRRR